MTIYKKKQWGGWRGRNKIKAFILPKPESSSIDGAFGKRQYAFICFFPSTHPIVFPFNYQLTEAILAVTGGWNKDVNNCSKETPMIDLQGLYSEINYFYK